MDSKTAVLAFKGCKLIGYACRPDLRKALYKALGGKEIQDFPFSAKKAEADVEAGQRQARQPILRALEFCCGIF